MQLHLIALCECGGPLFLRERYLRKLKLENAPEKPLCLLQPPGTDIQVIDYMSESISSSSEDIPFSESEESKKSGFCTDPISKDLESNEFDHTLDLLSHDDFYVVDTALVLSYDMSFIEGWVPWLEEHYRRGKRLYILDFVAQEVVDHGDTVPKYFQILQYEPEVSNAVMNDVLKQLKVAFSITQDDPLWKTGLMQVDLLNLAIASFAVDHADRMQFPENDRQPSKQFYLTSPTTPYYQFIYWPKDHEKYDDIIRANGLGSLMQFRRFDFQGGTWTDLPCRDSEP